MVETAVHRGKPEVGTLLLFVVDAANADQQTNTDYINGLQYDLKQLLSVSLSPSSQPAVDPRTEKAAR
jgi:hypothetical protein